MGTGRTIAAVGVALALGAGWAAHAAESFDCGDGKADAKTAKCVCPKGKVELTVSNVSRCIVPEVKKPVNAPAATAKPSAPPKPVTCPADMALIPAGKYWIGATGEQTGFQHDMPAFCMDRTEVTVADYEACAASGACPPPGRTIQWFHEDGGKSLPGGSDDRQLKFWSQFCNAGKPDRQDHPINCVTYEHAEAFCGAVGKRLPTSYEWQVAARGKQSRRFAWGDAAPSADTACWSRMDFDRMTGLGTCGVRAHEQGKTPEGIYGLTGNVWEWLWRDWNAQSYLQGYLAGGGWSTNSAQRMEAVQGHNGGVKSATLRRGSNVGFRCAR